MIAAGGKIYYNAEPLRGPIAQLVEHRADNAGVTGAIPVRPTKRKACCIQRDYRGYSSIGRAPALQAGGYRFDPGYLHQQAKKKF